ncbi:hypothetical protein BJX61DRAFT_541288 [Aspergillus egyptiacus]|nr:hypothetical protein BJX61DRAFT_541288 [Aspergillus egyptiacus]
MSSTWDEISDNYDLDLDDPEFQSSDWLDEDEYESDGLFGDDSDSSGSSDQGVSYESSDFDSSTSTSDSSGMIGAGTRSSGGRFQDSGAKLGLGFNVACLAGLAAFGLWALLHFSGSKEKGATLRKWYLLPVSLFFAILSILISLISLVLLEQDQLTSTKYQLAGIAVEWFTSLAVYLLMILLLIPICHKLRPDSGKILRILYAGWLVLCGILLLVSHAMYTRMQDAAYRSYDRVDASLPKATRDVTMAYYVFLMLAALLAAAEVANVLRKTKTLTQKQFLPRVNLIWATLGLGLTPLCGFANLQYGDRLQDADERWKSVEKVAFFTWFFYAIVWVSCVFIASSRLTSDDPAALVPLVNVPTTQPDPRWAPMPQGQQAQYQPIAPPTGAYDPAPYAPPAPYAAPAPYGAPQSYADQQPGPRW